MRPTMRSALPFLPYAVISVVHVAALALAHPIAPPTKLLLMPALLLAALWASAAIRPMPRGAVLLLVAAVLFSWLGDGAATFFPMFDDELPMMLLNFGIAHVCYLVLFWRGRGIAVRSLPVWAFAYAAVYVVLMVVLVPRAGSLALPVMLYGLLLVGTAMMASRCGPTIAWGGASFLVSDAILSLRIFVPKAMPEWTSGAVMLTYTLGQGLIVFGVVTALRRRAGERVTPPAA